MHRLRTANNQLGYVSTKPITVSPNFPTHNPTGVTDSFGPEVVCASFLSNKMPKGSAPSKNPTPVGLRFPCRNDPHSFFLTNRTPIGAAIDRLIDSRQNAERRKSYGDRFGMET